MSWLPVAVAALVAALAGWAAGPVLRALPEPLDDPDAAGKPSYASLATPGFTVGVGLAGGLSSLLAFALSPPELWLAWLALSGVGVLSAAIDLRTTWLPLPLARAGWACASAGVALAAVQRRDPAPLLWAAAGAMGLWLLFEVAWRVTGGFGYGDVRLMATVGAVTGAHDPGLVLPGALAGTLVGAAWGVVRHLRGGRGAFAYGPALLAGPFVALVWWSLAR